MGAMLARTVTAGAVLTGTVGAILAWTARLRRPLHLITRLRGTVPLLLRRPVVLLNVKHVSILCI